VRPRDHGNRIHLDETQPAHRPPHPVGAAEARRIGQPVGGVRRGQPVER